MKASPPSRGAWIEIGSLLKPRTASTCRPPRGGRGLKFNSGIPVEKWYRRPPRGGRGLKSCVIIQHPNTNLRVAPLAGGVD